MKAVVLFLLHVLFIGYAQAKDKYNVLLVVIDDLRTDTGTYRNNEGQVSDISLTPNLDVFSKESVQFQRSYVQVPLCGPSRASFLTGRTPQSLDYYYHGLIDQKDEDVIYNIPGVTMPMFFKNNGYATFGAGKVFHRQINLENEFQFSQPSKTKACDCIGGPDSCPKLKCTVPDSEVSDLTDYGTLHWGLDRLKSLKNRKSGKFFMTLGFRKPHLPFRVPVRFESKVSSLFPNGVPLAVSNERASESSVSNYYCSSMDEYAQVYDRDYSTQLHSEPFSDTLQRDIRFGYYTAVSWADYVVGQLLDGLKLADLYNNTIVVVTSDNGWQLGEHGNWCKNSATELSTRVPLWIRHPEGKNGDRENTIVSLVSLYPTLAELAGLSIPENVANKLHGRSFANLVVPNSDTGRLLRRNLDSPYSSPYAFSVVSRCKDIATEKLITCESTDQINVLGYSVRSDRWRYTEWRTHGRNLPYANSLILEKELYDHLYDDGTDPNQSENFNMASNSQYDSVMYTLSLVLKAHYGCSDNACDPDKITFVPSNVPTFRPTTASPSVAESNPLPAPIQPPVESPSPPVESPNPPVATPIAQNPEVNKQEVSSGGNSDQVRNVTMGIIIFAFFTTFVVLAIVHPAFRTKVSNLVGKS